MKYLKANIFVRPSPDRFSAGLGLSYACLCLQMPSLNYIIKAIVYFNIRLEGK